jgi:hypothetical protein
VGPAAASSLYVGIGPDSARVSETLFLLLRVENGWAATAPADGQRGYPGSEELRRLGFRFILLADDNFYPVTLDDLRQAQRRSEHHRLQELATLRAERFELMARFAQLPDDLVCCTQITMEAAEDPEFLDAMRKAHIRGASSVSNR